MELYHYSRYVLEDGSGVQQFLTRIDDEELPSLILPGIMFLSSFLLNKLIS